MITYEPKSLRERPFIDSPIKGRSSQAAQIENRKIELNNHISDTYFFGWKLERLNNLLYKAKLEYQAGRYSQDAEEENPPIICLNKARDFVFALSAYDIKEPDIYITPQGHVMFEWLESKYNLFAVLIMSNGDLSYTGVYGYNNYSGIETFEERLPSEIKKGIERLYLTQRFGDF
ncbi:hypothetical protein DEHALATV1_0061 [Dehalococcoides mccartyi]|uniref:Uncharacterized protein n=1 Tax=Dehalococcoides mccartyi TaxID=61435 RepID=A0AB33HNH3_9CHLR|nr:hypothetical protein [Dehalococcoides mccartyi]BAZ96689.1 hypothetical protein DEHALATV1_0061 [Dehalococcoides mccartyi]